jgi:phosphatidylglycerophosphate synthase
VFVLSVVVTLLVEEHLRLWEVALIGLRDWAVLLGGGWLIARDGWSAVRAMPPTLLGKATTALQFVFLVTLLTAESAARFVFIPAAVVSGAAAVDYLRLGLRRPPSGPNAQRDTRRVGK